MLLTLTAPPDRPPALATALVAAGGAAWAAPLFSDVSIGEGAFWGTLIGVGGPAAIWVASQFWKWWDLRNATRKEKRKEQQEDESAVVAAQDKLIARLERERLEFIRDLDGMQDEVRHMTAIISSAKERIVHLEEFVIASNPKYKPWTEPPAPSGRLAPKPTTPGGTP